MSVGADAGDNFSIAALNGPQRAPQCDYAARSPQRDVVEPARRDSQVLRQTNCRVGRERETADAQAIDLRLLKTCSAQQFCESAGKKRVRAAQRMSYIRHGDRRRDDGIAVVLKCAAY